MNFDIVVTSYKRPQLVEAAVLSCLKQGRLLREVIVVDDASLDATSDRIKAINDPRIKYLQRESNGGIGAARRDGFLYSRAEWTVSLDSDHELLPGALEVIANAIQSSTEQVDIVGAKYQWDTGAITPGTIPDYLVSYEDRIRLASLEDSIGQDYLCAISSRLRERVFWEPLRTGLPDTLFQLDIAKSGKALFVNQCLAIEKTSGEHSHSRGTTEQKWQRRLLDAADGVGVMQLILNRHCTGLKKWGKPLLGRLLTMGAFYAILSRKRWIGFRWAVQSIIYDRLSVQRIGLLVLSLMGPKCVEICYKLRK